MRRIQKLPHGRSEPAPASSKRGLPLARAEAMGNIGCTSVKADLRKGNKICCTVTAAGRARSQHQSCRPQGQCSRRAGGAPGRQQQFPCSLWREAPGGAGCPPAAHGSHMEQISTLQPPHGWRSPQWSRWMWPGRGFYNLQVLPDWLT